MNINKININQSEPTYYIATDIYDVSYHNNGATFESLSTLLADENLSTFIPTEVRCGGMTIRFIQSSDNKYVQYRLMTNVWSATVADWQGVDDEPTIGSENLVKSGGVFESFNDLNTAIEAETTRATTEEERLQGEIDNTNTDLFILDDRVFSNQGQLDELEFKTSEISKEVIETMEDELIIENNDGTEVFRLDKNGLDVKNLKSNGKSVLTKDEFDTFSDEGIELQTNDGKHITYVSYEERYNYDCELWQSNDGREIYATVTPDGIKAKNITLLDGTDIRYKDLTGKTLLAIGDSVTASGAYDSTHTSWQSFLGAKLGIKIKNHAKGGIGIIEMCDGTQDGDNPAVEPNGFGVDYLPPLSAEELTDVDYVVMLGFFNEIGKYPDKKNGLRRGY